jgi:hypothetical protein
MRAQTAAIAIRKDVWGGHLDPEVDARRKSGTRLTWLGGYAVI